MVDKKQQSSPDFNDEYLKYGLDVFTERLKKRLNEAVEISKEKSTKKPQAIEENDFPEMPDWVKEIPFVDDPDEQSDGWERNFLTGRDGPKGCAQNMTLILENDRRWVGVFAENVFTGSIDVMNQPPIPQIEIGELNDPHVAMIHIWIEENYSIVVQDAAMKKALINIAAKNRYHPVKDYLTSLPEWDGEPRSLHWLTEALGVSDIVPKEYLSAVGSRFLIGAVRRIMNAPAATKVDNMLVFEGLQGDGKSTLIEVLFSPWHGDTPLPLGDKDAYINIRGCWGYEMAEMDSFNKATVSTAKTFMSSHTDNYRPPFGTKNVKYPRQTVLIGSVNHAVYLTDTSGNRRYWPVWADRINVGWLKNNREQLWAEALHRCRDNQIHWIDNKKEPELAALIKYEQALREHPDAWEAALFIWMDGGDCMKEHYSTVDILMDVIKMDLRSINKSHEMKLSNAMEKLGWQKKRKRVEGYNVPKPYLYITPKWAIDKRSGNKPVCNVREAVF